MTNMLAMMIGMPWCRCRSIIAAAGNAVLIRHARLPTASHLNEKYLFWSAFTVIVKRFHRQNWIEMLVGIT